MRKALANILILVGIVLAAWGISGWSGDGSIAAMILPDGTERSGSAAWPVENRVEIVAGALLLTIGLLLRADSK